MCYESGVFSQPTPGNPLTLLRVISDFEVHLLHVLCRFPRCQLSPAVNVTSCVFQVVLHTCMDVVFKLVLKLGIEARFGHQSMPIFYVRASKGCLCSRPGHPLGYIARTLAQTSASCQ
ncbi:hypothetical protein KP509_36G054300 [Ceratopteris richardii]|uniref:Uncharacterized protein n=1 Tax=Ceratopteris richardii TaxID=49495 RepID=A0A8T2QC19_CERRI|nr:hypothetical protein KP509_36G054300 [Ceratopteris richardii]